MIRIPRPHLSLKVVVKILNPVEGLNVDGLDRASAKLERGESNPLHITKGELLGYDLKPGKYSVWLPMRYMDAYRIKGNKGLNVKPNETCVREVVLYVPERSDLELCVVLEAAQVPLTGVKVSVTDQMHQRVDKVKTTDAAGVCSLEGVPQEECTARISLLNSVERCKFVNAGEKRITLTIPGIKAIRGKVLFPDGNAHSYNVILRDEESKKNYRSRMDADGRFLITHKVRAKGRLLISAKGYDDQWNILDCSAEYIEPEIKLQKPVELTYTIAFEGKLERPLEEARVSFARKGPLTGGSRSERLALGKACSTRLALGTYSVFVVPEWKRSPLIFLIGKVEVREEGKNEKRFEISSQTFEQTPVDPSLWR